MQVAEWNDAPVFTSIFDGLISHTIRRIAPHWSSSQKVVDFYEIPRLITVFTGPGHEPCCEPDKSTRHPQTLLDTHINIIKSHVLFPFLTLCQRTNPRPDVNVLNMLVFLRCKILSPLPGLSVSCSRIAFVSCTCNLRSRHTVVTGTKCKHFVHSFVTAFRREQRASVGRNII